MANRTGKGHFKKDNRKAKGGRRRGAGAPTKEQVRERAAEVQGLERAKRIIERKIEKYATRIAERYVTRALEKNADSVLMDAVRKILPEPKQEIDVTQRHSVIYQTIDPNAERRRNRDRALKGPFGNE